jgi:hypothetical protein
MQFAEGFAFPFGGCGVCLWEEGVMSDATLEVVMQLVDQVRDLRERVKMLEEEVLFQKRLVKIADEFNPTGRASG